MAQLTAISGEQQKNNGNYTENNTEKWKNKKLTAKLTAIIRRTTKKINVQLHVNYHLVSCRQAYVKLGLFLGYSAVNPDRISPLGG